MWKFIPILALAFSACSSFTINATMCEKIAADPHQMMPEECRNYSEKEAEKAFFKEEKKRKNRDDIIKFSKEADEKQN